MKKKIYKAIIELSVWSIIITAFLIPMVVILNQDKNIIINMVYLHTYFISMFLILNLMRGDF